MRPNDESAHLRSKRLETTGSKAETGTMYPILQVTANLPKDTLFYAELGESLQSHT